MKLSSGAFILPLSLPKNLFADYLKIPVLMYHDISNEFDDEYTISPPLFAAQMEWLYSNGYKTIFFNEVDKFIKPGDDRAAIITFDDGYASFGSYTFPLLKEYGFKATINAIGKHIGSYIKLARNRPLLSWDEYRHFIKSGLVELGCHTYDLHIYKSGLGILGFTQKEIEDDFRLFQDVAKKETGHDTKILAWPYGLYDKKTMNIAQRAGFKYILTSNEGYLQKDSDLLKIPRRNINNRHDLVSFQQYLRGGV
ncbi:MAG: polysaccharide deacetylase family protein [Thermodesulfobacteriota bacterium]|nr:polysaccharide deacetylase family protein [Thermodesulfobacteriota bacterium]